MYFWVLLSVFFALISLAALPAHANASSSVPLMVEEPSGIQRKGWPITSGVPLPEGAVNKKKKAIQSGFSGNGKSFAQGLFFTPVSLPALEQ